MKKSLNIHELQPGMVVAQDIHGANGQLLIKEGIALTETHINYFKNYNIKQIEVFEYTREPEMQQLQRIYRNHLDRAQDRQYLIEPQYLSIFMNELRIDIANFCTKMVNTHVFGQDFANNIEVHLYDIIEKPDVLNALLKVKLSGEGSLSKAVQVAILATTMGKKMAMSKKVLKRLTISALLYDIGNFWVKRSLLAKPTLLNELEKRIVEEHTITGYSVLKEWFDEEIARVAYQHHERYDGSGYPCQIRKEEIDFFTRIISICDVYIALISPRPFRQKYEPLEALEYILGAGGTFFDPELVRLFLEIIPLYSVGSMVQLSNHCIAVVVKTKDKPLSRPVVEILVDEDGKFQNNQKIDLTKHLTISIKKVL